MKIHKYLILAITIATTSAQADWVSWFFDSDYKRAARARQQLEPMPLPVYDPIERERQAALDRLDEITELKREALADKFFGAGNHY